MIRLVMYSEDPKLHPLLYSALRPEFSVVLELNKERLKQIAIANAANVLMVDLDPAYCSPEGQKAICDIMAESPIPVVVMTSDMSRVRAMDFLQQGAYDCIRKPPSLIELRIVIRRAHEHALMKKELASAREAVRSTSSCEELVGSSGRAQVVYDLIHRLAGLNAFVLITGESGTGKELVARAIHNLGNRAKQPFVAVSCGAIPETLIESELFGHEKGAFTGASGARAGYLEQAGSGTLFLDEIGELSLSTQVKLLRVLQQREFTRLGSSKPLPLNARVLFATHRNLSKMVEEGTFRRDLFFRVNVMTIHVPPLRERTEDIPMLARHFLKRYSEQYEKQVDDIRPKAMELLVEYSWPGNVRELENVIQGAVIMTDGESVSPSDLPEQIRQLADESIVEPVEPDSFEDLLRQFKVSLANKAVLECNGNKTLAARKLRVSRAYLHRLIRVSPDEAEAEARPTAITMGRHSLASA